VVAVSHPESAQSGTLAVGVGVVLVVVVAWVDVAFAAATLRLRAGRRLPTPAEVGRAFGGELASGRLLADVIASLYRVAWGFVGGVVLAVPLGLVIGRSVRTRAALLPWVNFFRSLSPIAWVPFAIIWFGVNQGASLCR
jgi:NitT/TauT family transport system permease protein